MNREMSFRSVCTFMLAATVLFFLVAAVSDAAVGGVKDTTPKPEAAAPAKQPLPLAPERKIEFSTDEGTWLSLDVSPDGKTIIFELLGHLYVVPFAGGETKAITSGMSFNSQPRFSPDGKQIAFISDRGGAENLWIADADGSHARQLSKDEQSEFASPAWLPDGNFVIVSRQAQLPAGDFELWAYHVKGGSGIAVVKSKEKPDTPSEHWRHAVGAVASPDGRYLYYTQREGFFDKVYNVSFPLSQIARRDRRTGDEDVITDEPGSAFRPLLSPDGTRLIYGTRYETETGLKIRDLKSGEEKWLKYPVQRDDQESIFTRDFLPGYAFTPDGKEVVLAYGGKIHRIDVESGEEHLIPFTAKVSRELGPLLNFPERIDEGPVRSRLIQGPVQSPDGKRLAFSALTHLYVMGLPDGKPVRVTKSDDREYQPAWSPDGQWLAFVSWSPQGGGIWKVRADGCCAPEQLTQTPAYYRDVMWTLDGERLVALRGSHQWQLEKTDEWSGPGSLLDLIWLPVQGGPANVIVPARGARSPHFVFSQKDRIYLYTKQGLTSVRFDGTDRRVHLKVSGKRWFPEPGASDEGEPADDVRMSPDGQWVVARVSSQLYLIPAPSFGGEPPTVDVTMAAAPKTPEPEAPMAKPKDAVDADQPSASANLPVEKITSIGADYFAWADGGKTLTWGVGPSFFREPISAVSFNDSAKPGNATTATSNNKKSAAAESKEPATQSRKERYEEIGVKLEFPRYTPQGSALLRGARAITMHGDEVIDNADILVTDNRIAKVGKQGSFAIPDGAKVIDVSGSTIVPGFIDTHPHWTEIRRGVLDPEDNWSFFANLAYGVTSGRDPQTMTDDMFAYQDLVDIGEIPGPRAFSTGPGVFPTNNFQSLDEVRSVVSRYKSYYRTKTLKSYMVGNRKQRQWMIQACKEQQMMPTTEGGLDVKLDLTHMIDGFSGNEHSLPVTPLYKDIIELIAQSKVSSTPTLLVAYGGPFAENYYFETTEVHDDAKVRHFIPHNIVDARTKRRTSWFRSDEQVFPRLAAQDKKIIEAGGRVCIGSHGQFQGLGYHWEMWSLASGGVGNFDVLRAATIHGAEAIGYPQDLGSIEEGKLADLVVLAKNPLDDIHNTNTIRFVMKNGELFEGDTLNAVWPRQKLLPKQWWWDEKP